MDAFFFFLLLLHCVIKENTSKYCLSRNQTTREVEWPGSIELLYMRRYERSRGLRVIHVKTMKRHTTPDLAVLIIDFGLMLSGPDRRILPQHFCAGGRGCDRSTGGSCPFDRDLRMIDPLITINQLINQSLCVR